MAHATNAAEYLYLSDTVKGLTCDIINEYTTSNGTSVNGVICKSNALTASSLKGNAASNQIVLQPGGSGTTLTITAANPATSSRVLTLPDPGGADSFTYAAIAQTLTNKTISSAAVTGTFTGAAAWTGTQTFGVSPSLTAASNQLVIQPSGSGNTITINATNPASNRIYTIPDTGADCNIQMGIPTVNHITSTATGVITNALSGMLFYIDSAAAAVTVQLPAPTRAGLIFKFVVTSSSLANAATIASTGANLFANIQSNDGTVVTGGNPSTAKTNVILGTGSKLGDWYEVVSDGTNYWVKGCTSLHTAVTFS